MRSSTTSLYLRILAVVDNAVQLVAPLRELIFYSTNIDVQVINDFSCRFHTWLAFTVTALSAWILSVVSIDRLILVKFPLWAKVHCSKKSAAHVVIILTILVGIINSHMLLYLDRATIYSMDENTNRSVVFDVACLPYSKQNKIIWHNVWPIMVLILYSVGPTVCLVACSILLIRSLTVRNVLTSSSIKLQSLKMKQNLNPNNKEPIVSPCLGTKSQINDQRELQEPGTSQGIKLKPHEKDKIVTVHSNHSEGITESHRSGKRLNVNQAAQNTAKHRDLRPLTKMMITVCVFFLACTFPVCVFLIVERVFFDVNIPKDLAS